MNERSSPASPAISFCQLAALITVCRISALMTHIPLINEGFSLAEQLTALALSAVIGGVLVIPAAVLYKRYGREGIAENAHRPLNVLFSAACILYMLIACTNELSDFTDFISARFSADVPAVLIALITVVAVLYCAHCGVEGLGRGSGAVIILFVIMTFSMLIGSADKINAEHLQGGFRSANMTRALGDDLLNGTELAALCLMGRYTAKDYRKGAYLSLAGRLAAAVTVTLCSVLVLGRYAYISEYPFLDMGAAAGIGFLQRVDSVYMIVWVLAAALSLALKIFIAGEMLKDISGLRLPHKTVFTAAVCAGALILPSGYTGSDTVRILTAALSAAAVTAPLAILISKNRKGGHARNAEKQKRI